MEQSIKNVEAVLNLCISRGAFKTLAEAQQATQVLQQLSVDYKSELEARLKLSEELKGALAELNSTINMVGDEMEKRANPIPKQSELKPVAQEKEK